MIDRPVLDMESVVAKIPLALDRFSLLGLSPSVMDVHLVPPCDSLQPDGLRSCEEDSQICLVLQDPARELAIHNHVTLFRFLDGSLIHHLIDR